MKFAIETIAASATAPGAGGAAMAAVTGDSLTIRDSAAGTLIDVMADFQAVGRLRITSPLLHDSTVGLSYRIPINTDSKPFGMVVPQVLTPQDTLVMNAIGSATAGDVELAALTIMYEDLAGIDGRFIDSKELYSRLEDVFVPRLDVTTTAAGWSGDVAITALDDQFKANREYAWLGMVSDDDFADVLAIGMVSPDFGNLRIGCPVPVQGVCNVANYFIKLSDKFGISAIPVINSSQKSNIILSGLGNENAASYQGSLIFGLLGTKKAKRK